MFVFLCYQGEKTINSEKKKFKFKILIDKIIFALLHYSMNIDHNLYDFYLKKSCGWFMALWTYYIL